MTTKEYDEFSTSNSWMQHSKRLSIHPYIPPPSFSSNHIPINILRNTAISKAQTSHVWIMDLDIIPSTTLYDALYSIPSKYLKQSNLAITVPVFSIHYHNCDTIESCKEKYFFLLELDEMCRLVKDIPHSNSELMACIKRDQCSLQSPDFLEKTFAFNSWSNRLNSQKLQRFQCLPKGTHDLYVMVQKSENLPKLDERMVNHAYDKMEWIEHLRYRGFTFVSITNGFVIDPTPLKYISFIDAGT